jgi:asparagine synthase (glutamine-hydrolysing)
VSGICGVVSLDGRPVAEEALRSIVAAMAAWGPDGINTWRGDGVGLAHLHLRSTPEAHHESLPVADPTGRRVLTAAARLDNRAELLGLLGPWKAPVAEIPDSALVLRAYERWSGACVDRLLGDWAFALWETGPRRLFLARDQNGVTSLYYVQGPHWFGFASSLAGLLAYPDVPRVLDELPLARALAGHIPDQDATVYQDIRALPHAHTLSLTAGALTVRRYWNVEDAPPLRRPTDAAYVEAAAGVYADAVRCRLRAAGPVGVTLSGGLDSGSVAMIAAPELRGAGRALSAFSSVPVHDASRLAPRHMTDESPLIEAIRAAGAIDLTYCRAEDVTPLAGARRTLEVLGSPLFQVASAYWLHAVLEAARTHGVNVLLTGQSGNLTMSWAGGRREAVRALARQRRWRPLAEELLVAAGPVARSRLRIRSRQRAPAPSLADTSVVNRAWAADLGIGRPPLPTRLDMIVSRRDVAGAVWSGLGHAYGLDVRDPTGDQRVLELCLGVPDDQYFRRGQPRQLIRRVMAGRMPDSVLSNTRRGRQAADIGARLLASADEVGDAIDQVRRSPLAQRCLDVDRVGASWAALQDGLTPDSNDGAGQVLLPGVSVGLFLTSFE